MQHFVCFERTEFKFDPYHDKKWGHATPNGVACNSEWSCMRLPGTLHEH